MNVIIYKKADTKASDPEWVFDALKHHQKQVKANKKDQIARFNLFWCSFYADQLFKRAE